MKKYTWFMVFFALLFSFSVVNAEDSGCLPGDNFSRTTGKPCAVMPSVSECNSGDLFSSVTGKPCTSQIPRVCYTFNNNLGVGIFSEEVSNLVDVLAREGLMEKRLAAEFDETIASAVSAFQEKYRSEILTPAGLKSPTGYVGARTRAKLNALYGCGVSQIPQQAQNLYIDPQKVSVKVGGTTYLQALLQTLPPACTQSFPPCLMAMPIQAPYPVYATWTSSNPETASVVNTSTLSLYGSVTGKAVGTATIKATYKDGSGTFTATASVIVVSGETNSNVQVLSPNGGETWQRGKEQKITWQGGSGPYDIKLYAYYSSCTGEICTQAYNQPTITTIANGVAGSSLEWGVPGCSTTYPCVPDDTAAKVYYKVQVCQQAGSLLCDLSNNYFKMLNP